MSYKKSFFIVFLFFLVLSVGSVSAGLISLFNGSWGIESEVLADTSVDSVTLFSGSWGIESEVVEDTSGSMVSNFSGSWGVKCFTEYYVYTNWSSWWVMHNYSTPLVFGENPSNGSNNQGLSFTWNCTIENPDGYSFDWTIECSNGQSNSGDDDTNGSKSVSLSGLGYATSYTVWVNVSHNETTDKDVSYWYSFTTTDTLIVINPYPSNNSVDVESTLSSINVTIQDPEGDSFNWSIELSNGNTSSANGASNGSKVCPVNISCGVVSYTWWVNVTDGSDVANYTFYFTSEACLPNVTTNSSTGIGLSNATLHGFLNRSGGEGCSIWFEYGFSTGYGNTTSYVTSTLDDSEDENFYSGDSLGGGSTSNFWDEDWSTMGYVFSGLLNTKTGYIYENYTVSDDTLESVRCKYYLQKTGGTSSFRVSAYNYTSGSYNILGSWSGGTVLGSDYNRTVYVNSSDYVSGNEVRVRSRIYASGTAFGGANTGYYEGMIETKGLLDSGNEFSKEITGLSNSSTYHYRAAANNSNGTAYGSDMTVTTLPGSVHSFDASNYDSSGVNVTWISTSGVDSVYLRYKIGSYPSSRADGSFLINDSVNISYNHSSLNLGTGYYYRGWSWNTTSGWGDYNSSIGYTNPGCPSSLQETDTTINSISLQWSKGTNATRSVVFRNSSGVANYPNATNGVEVINTTGNTGTDNGLNQNVTYWYSVYSYNPSGNLFSECNSTDNASTLESAGAVSNLVVSRFNHDQLNLSWSKSNPSDDTVVVRKTGSSPSGVSDGTEVYNGSLTSYKDAGLSAATHYYYRTWGWNGFEYSAGSSADDNITRPEPPQDFAGDLDGSDLVMTWVKGDGAARTVIRNDTGSYPSSVTDGYLVYNDTGTTHTEPGVGGIDYYSGWSYVVVDGVNLYSLDVELLWGGIEINVYKENEPNIEIGNYTVFITNSDASETYQNTSGNNPFRIDVSDVPNGDDITIQISKSGYKTRSQVMDLDENTYYTVSFYLPPSSEGSPDDESGEDWYVPPADTLITDVFVVDDPASDETETLDCSPDDLESIFVYNSSIYGGWIEVADEYYSISGSTLTVNASVFDSNSTLIRVTYYCDADEEYSSHYIITVEDNAERSVEDAFFVIEAYINTSDSYEDVFSDYTDSSGQVEVDLIPDTVYYVTISKDDYDTTQAYWSPPEISQWEDSQKKFILYPIQSDYTNETSYGDCISFTGEYNDISGFVNFSWAGSNCGSISNFSIWIYVINTTDNITSYRYSYNDSVNQSANVVFDIYDLNNTFFVKLYLNSTVFGGHWNSLYINPSHSDAHSGYSYTSSDEFDSFFEDIFGGNSLGWSGLFGIFILLACLFAFGQQNAGVGLILCGFVMLGFNVMFGLVMLNATICIVIVVFGILVQWKTERRTR